MDCPNRRSVVDYFNGGLHFVSLLVLIPSLLLSSIGCAVPISYYDVTTYTNLTELKVEMSMLIESFDSKPVTENETSINAVTLRFRKAYEYERGKGNLNSDTMQQFKGIERLFNDDITQYREKGPGGLGPKYFQEAARVLQQAFDIVIATENEKNKDKR